MTSKFKHHLSVNKFWYIPLVCMLILSIVLGSMVFSTEEEKRTHLIVDEVFFVFEGMDETSMDLKIIIFLTNDERSEIDNVQVRAFVIETNSNLAMDEDTIEMGTVGGGKTIEGELHVKIPTNDTYRIELLVFEESKLSIRGEGSINLEGVGTADDYKNIEDDLYSMEESENGMFFIGCGLTVFLAILGIIVIIIVIINVIKNDTKKSTSSQESNLFPEGDLEDILPESEIEENINGEGNSDH